MTCLARGCARAAKHERQQELKCLNNDPVAAATTPTPKGQKCKTCGQLFASCKTYTRHTCMTRKKKEKALTTNVTSPKDTCVVPEAVQEQAEKCPATPPPPTPPLIPINNQPQTLVTDQSTVYLVTQYCCSCNQKHNLGPFTACEVDPPGTEIIMSCPSHGHRLYSNVSLHPVNEEST